MTVATINLSGGKSFLINFEDLLLVAGRHCAIASNGYVRVSLPDGTREYVHRLVCPTELGFHVDHINGNKLDVTRENLRAVTRSQNLCNRGKTSHNTTGYKGVHFCHDTEKFRASLRVNGIAKDLGRHVTAEEAARAYDAAARRYHGEFARLNFPEIAS